MRPVTPDRTLAWAREFCFALWSMIRKSGYRFSEKIMLNQKPRARWCFNSIPSRSGIVQHPNVISRSAAIALRLFCTNRSLKNPEGMRRLLSPISSCRDRYGAIGRDFGKPRARLSAGRPRPSGAPHQPCPRCRTVKRRIANVAFLNPKRASF